MSAPARSHRIAPIHAQPRRRARAFVRHGGAPMPASLTPLKPPALIATEEEAGVELVALEAGRSPQGLMATLQAKNRHVDAYQTIALGDPRQHEALVCKVYPNTRG